MSLDKQLLTCTLCLKVFTKPKLLPCFHSYCEECLKNLAARHGGRSFPCPNCRKDVPVPKGGVSVFQSNFYIDSAELKRAKKTSCTTHAKNDLVSFCSTCDLVICVECMLEQHKTHDIQTFGKKARLSKDQLRKDKDWLCETERSLQTRMIHANQNRQALQDKVDEVKTEIETRCAQVVSNAEQHRDEVLAKVDALAEELDSTEEDDEVTETLQEKCTSLKESLAAVQETLDRGNDFEIVTLAKEMSGDRKECSLDMVPEHWPKDVFHFPALQVEDVTDIASAVSSFIGHVTTRSISRTESSRYIVETIKCSRPNIHCLSFLKGEDVCVSYEQDDAPVQRFNKHGVLIETMSDLVGKVAFHSYPGRECLYITPQKGKQVLCAKFNHPPFVLERDHSGKGVVKKVDVKAKATVATKWTEVFTFSCSGDLVAFDTSASETKFALIEESQSDGLARCLKIYHMANSEPTSSFSFKSFQPSDVCFCKIEGTELCLVADETHNSIRMLNDEDGSMDTFIPQTGELGQPAALNTDKHERLWIGCRDGRIFRCQPKSSKQLKATRSLPLAGPDANLRFLNAPLND